jgi:ribosome-binding protein aMBF1 (putative translation factor)
LVTLAAKLWMPKICAMAALSHDARRARSREMANAVSQGSTLSEVAARYGVSAATVALACRKWGQTPNKAKALRRQQILQAISAGRDRAVVAAEMGVSLEFVHYVCRGSRLLRRRGRPRVSEDEFRDRWRDVDWTQQDAVIARAKGCSREYIRQVRQRLGIPSRRMVGADLSRELAQSLGRLISAARVASGLTRSQLAKILKITSADLLKIESGGALCGPEFIDRVARILAARSRRSRERAAGGASRGLKKPPSTTPDQAALP